MKLQEEVDELLTAPEEKRLEELADVFEVLRALAADLGADEESLTARANTKSEERGAFETRYWLLDVNPD